MNDEQFENEKEIKVSILFTESTSSLLDLEIPYLEDLHTSDTKVCVITQSETNYRRPIKSAADIRHRNRFKNWDSSMKSDIAFFAKDMNSSTTLFDDLSSLSLDEKSNRSNSLPLLLEPKKIHTRPLVTLKSTAHGNNLDVSNSNKILVSLIDLEADTSNEYMCRICHGGDSIDDLLTPCRCRGTVALAHLQCLQRWLRESSHSYCELCQHHYQILREPRYGIVESIFVYLRHPGPNLKDILLDTLALIVYTPSAIASNYMLLIVCESVAKINLESNTNLSAHLVAFTSLLGIAAIDFAYTSWVFTTLEKHFEAWNSWYKSNCTVKVILPRSKMRPLRSRKKNKNTEDIESTPEMSCRIESA